MLKPPDGEECTPPPLQDSRETPQTNSKVVFSGLENGSFELFDLGFKRSVHRSPPASSSSSSSLTSIAYSQSTNLLATGSARGLVTLYDTRNLASLLASFSRLETVIEDIAFVQTGATGSVGLAIATSDGLPYIASVLPEGPMVHAELIGADCDPVRNLKVRLNDVWSASDDGIVRRYVL
jgi:proteasomal ATPase-associated factor 1